MRYEQSHSGLANASPAARLSGSHFVRVYLPLCRGDKLALNTVADFIQVQSLRRSQDQVAVGSENSAAPKRRRLIRADEFR